MKKIISLVLVAVLIGTTAYALGSPGIGDILGQGKFPSDPHKIFRLVRYVPSSYSLDSATLVDQSMVVWDKTSDDGVTVTTTTTSPDSSVAGIIALDVLTPDTGDAGNTAYQDIGKKNWTWLQTYGYALVRITGAVAAGNAMGTSATAGESESFIPQTTDSTKNGFAGFYYDSAAAASDDVECFVRCD